MPARHAGEKRTDGAFAKTKTNRPPASVGVTSRALTFAVKPSTITRMPTYEQPDTGRPSRSANRREALDVLAFAKQLSELPSARLDKLGLPEDIRIELAEVRRIPSHVAHKRQLAHLAKLMRRHDNEDFAAARAALASERAVGARETAKLHRVEAMRENLLGEDGDTALTSFVAEYPGVDRQRMRALIRQARREREAGKPARAQRELFRLLRDATGDREPG
jgi:ribosome-associated protein